MAGPTTEVLNEDIKELRQASKEILAEVRRVADSVHALELEQGRRFGQLDTRLGRLEERVDSLRGNSKFALGVSIAILGSVLASAGGAIWYAAKLDARVGQVEQTQSRAEAPKR